VKEAKPNAADGSAEARARALEEEIRQLKAAQEQADVTSLELAIGLAENFDVLQKVAAGDYTARSPESSTNELVAKLAQTINRMATSVEQTMDNLFGVFKRVSEGDYSARAPERAGNDLMAKLGASVNQTIEAVQAATQEREEANKRLAETQDMIMSLSTPVIQIWDGVIALPLIGVLDSQRSQQAMEILLERIIRDKARTAIVDITGVPLVDSLVANHLAQTMAAVKLIGAEGILTGISANVAQTLVKLGVDIAGITTRSTLAEGLKYALTRTRAESATAAKESGR
jgi:rsbT co-antagonist protein RsbR